MLIENIVLYYFGAHRDFLAWKVIYTLSLFCPLRVGRHCFINQRHLWQHFLNPHSPESTHSYSIFTVEIQKGLPLDNNYFVPLSLTVSSLCERLCQLRMITHSLPYNSRESLPKTGHSHSGLIFFFFPCQDLSDYAIRDVQSCFKSVSICKYLFDVTERKVLGSDVLGVNFWNRVITTVLHLQK